jgi:hypothetical protein
LDALIDDGLHLPPHGDPGRALYKEWLHVNIIDHDARVVGLVNASLHGDPDDPRSMATGAALLHIDGVGWVGNAATHAFSEASLGTSSIALRDVGIVVEPHRGRVLASASMPLHRFSLEVEMQADARPFAFAEPFPYGSGWMSWYGVPRLTVRGRASFDGREIPLDGAIGYHDHNWGRFRWGDDARWEWGAMLAADGSSFVFARATTRDFRTITGGPLLIADTAAGRRTFGGAAVSILADDEFDQPLRRMPGALAALHQDWMRPPLPRRVVIRAGDGIDRLTIELRFEAAAQIITADSAEPRYGFVHELSGVFEASGIIAGGAISTSGLVAYEHVL